MSEPSAPVGWGGHGRDARVPSQAARPPTVAASAGGAITPIFVVGSGRSGTTLTASILDGHSALATGPETGFFRTFPAVQERVLRDPEWPDKAVRFLMSLNRMTGQVAANYGVNEALLRATLLGRPRTAGRHPGCPLWHACGLLGARRWVEQTPTHILSVREIRQEWPDAPIIRLLRDPRGVAASYLKVPFGPGTAVGAAYLWQLHDDAARATLDDDPHMTIAVYEALLANPEAEVRRICAFIGEAFEPGMLGSGVPAANPSPAGQRPNWLTSVVIDSSRAEAWHTELSTPGPGTRHVDRRRRHGTPRVSGRSAGLPDGGHPSLRRAGQHGQGPPRGGRRPGDRAPAAGCRDARRTNPADPLLGTAQATALDRPPRRQRAAFVGWVGAGHRRGRLREAAAAVGHRRHAQAAARRLAGTRR